MLTAGEFLTPSITKLELLAFGNVIGVGTGFFLKCDEAWHIVSNWHVLSGRDPQTGKPRRKDGAVPDTCRFWSGSLVENSHILWTQHELLLVDPNSGASTWKQHQLGQRIDIAALPVDTSLIGLAKDFLDPTGNRPNMWVSPGSDLLIPGYPLGLSSNGRMPIWKRASLASSLQFGHSMHEYFFVDTATREGMSGAPCLAIAAHTQFYEMVPETSKIQLVTDMPGVWRFLGVYSGRKNPSDSFEAQIGVVWRENLALDIITSGYPGDYVLRPV